MFRQFAPNFLGSQKAMCALSPQNNFWELNGSKSNRWYGKSKGTTQEIHASIITETATEI
jgi:hypothetical protein